MLEVSLPNGAPGLTPSSLPPGRQCCRMVVRAPGSSARPISDKEIPSSHTTSWLWPTSFTRSSKSTQPWCTPCWWCSCPRGSVCWWHIDHRQSLHCWGRPATWLRRTCSKTQPVISVTWLLKIATTCSSGNTTSLRPGPGKMSYQTLLHVCTRFLSSICVAGSSGNTSTKFSSEWPHCLSMPSDAIAMWMHVSGALHPWNGWTSSYVVKSLVTCNHHPWCNVFLLFVSTHISPFSNIYSNWIFFSEI